MTFKHIHFEDSPTMRSLTRVAQEKGWVKPEPPRIKTAAPLADLSPSKDLTENLLKLCSGLRSSGFDKQADELENKFLSYKQAQSIYGVGGETGEDLVHAAHPKGSHKLIDVDSKEATVEDILDKHMQFLKVVNTEPKGKLASTQDILSAVKVVLAAEGSDEAARRYWQDLLKETTNLVNNIITNEDLSDWTYHAPSWMKEKGLFGMTPEIDTGMALKTTKGHLESVIGNLNNLARKPPSNDVVKNLQATLNSVMSLVQSADNIAPKSKTNYLATARDIYSRVDQTLQILRGEAGGPPSGGVMRLPETTVKPSPLASLFQQVNALKSKIQSWLAIRNIAQNPTASKWIQDEVKILDGISQRYGQVSEDQEANMMEPMQQEVSSEAKDIDTFKSLWFKAQS